jgi:hypothetical protein
MRTPSERLLWPEERSLGSARAGDSVAKITDQHFLDFRLEIKSFVINRQKYDDQQWRES